MRSCEDGNAFTRPAEILLSLGGCEMRLVLLTATRSLQWYSILGFVFLCCSRLWQKVFGQGVLWYGAGPCGGKFGVEATQGFISLVSWS